MVVMIIKIPCFSHLCMLVATMRNKFEEKNKGASQRERGIEIQYGCVAIWQKLCEMNGLLMQKNKEEFRLKHFYYTLLDDDDSLLGDDGWVGR